MAKSVVKEDFESEVAKHSSVELNSFKAVCWVAELHADLGDRSHQLSIDLIRVGERKTVAGLDLETSRGEHFPVRKVTDGVRGDAGRVIQDASDGFDKR